MRLWSLHPKYLDRQGLLAVWREGLLAQKVLQGRTRGYQQHPQLDRFKAQVDPLAAIAAYLQGICSEATKRAYIFDRSKIATNRTAPRIDCTRGQLSFELEHLRRKLSKRDPQFLKKLTGTRRLLAHPLFKVVRGSVEKWEKR